MAGNPLASLPGLPQRPSLARSSASETRLTQPGIEAARSRKLNPAPTAAFRLKDATGGAQSAMMRQLIAHCIAGHHAGLPDSIGDLDERLLRKFEPLSSIWREEITLDDAPLTVPEFSWRKERNAQLFQFGFLGRMIFSCLVDADFRDTEAFYAEAEKRRVDRTWPRLPEIIDDLIARFGRYMRDKRARAPVTPVNDLRAEMLDHVRGGANAKTG